MVLVDGAGPGRLPRRRRSPGSTTRSGRPPAEGQATLFDTLDSPGLDATSVATEYRDTTITRRFLQADDRYLRGRPTPCAGAGGSLTWMLHGNGGGTSGGTFAPTDERRSLGDRRGPPRLGDRRRATSRSRSTPSNPRTRCPTARSGSHTALRATVPSGSADALQVFYPTPIGAAAPVDHADRRGRSTQVSISSTRVRTVTWSPVRDASGQGVHLVDDPPRRFAARDVLRRCDAAWCTTV